MNNDAATKPAKTPKIPAKHAATPAYAPVMRVTFEVAGSEPTPYTVTHGTYNGLPHPHGWSCTCQDYYYRHAEKGGHCKHITAVLAKLPSAFVSAMIAFNGRQPAQAGYGVTGSGTTTPATGESNPAAKVLDLPTNDSKAAELHGKVASMDVWLFAVLFVILLSLVAIYAGQVVRGNL